MRTRILSGAVLTVILLIAVFTGRYGMFVLALAASSIGLYEMYHVVNIHRSALGIVGYVLCAVYYALTWFDAMQYIYPFMVSSGLIFMFVYVLSYSHKSAEQAGFGLLGLYYVAIPFSFLYRIRTLDDGICFVALLIFSTWIADVFAYFVGSAIGKHKLAPKLSPHKSIEGAVGGVLASTVIGTVFGAIYGTINGKERLWLLFGIMCLFGSIISIFGDLSASAIKRHYNVKDYGKIIPGHGGVMDRFDSMTFVAPTLYFFAVSLYPLIMAI